MRGPDYPSVASVMSNWAELNDCSAEPVQTLAKGAATCETYQECRSDVRVTLCSLEGMGHCWPGAGACVFGTAVSDISATDLTWDFFSEFALP
jgi:polyhydroxybutyrate depolymerase